MCPSPIIATIRVISTMIWLRDRPGMRSSRFFINVTQLRDIVLFGLDRWHDVAPRATFRSTSQYNCILFEQLELLLLPQFLHKRPQCALGLGVPPSGGDFLQFRIDIGIEDCNQIGTNLAAGNGHRFRR